MKRIVSLMFVICIIITSFYLHNNYFQVSAQAQPEETSSKDVILFGSSLLEYTIPTTCSSHPPYVPYFPYLTYFGNATFNERGYLSNDTLVYGVATTYQPDRWYLDVHSEIEAVGLTLISENNSFGCDEWLILVINEENYLMTRDTTSHYFRNPEAGLWKLVVIGPDIHYALITILSSVSTTPTIPPTTSVSETTTSTLLTTTTPKDSTDDLFIIVTGLGIAGFIGVLLILTWVSIRKEQT